MSDHIVKYLYALVIGLLLVAFVGFGLATFYPSPEYPEYPTALESRTKPSVDLTSEELVLEQDYQQKSKDYQTEMSTYNLYASIVLIAISIIILTVSMLWLSKIEVISEGLTLGGLFTLIYGLGRGVAVDNNIYRFVAVAAGLVVILLLTYVKFIRKSEPTSLS